MYSRRNILACTGTFIAASAAGCQDLVLGDGVEVESKPAEVSEDAVADAGFEHERTEAYTIDEMIEVAGESRELKATSWIAVYSKDFSTLEGSEALAEEFPDLEGRRIAGFAVVSTPSETIAGQELNPVAHLDDDDLVDRFSDELSEGEIEEIERIGEESATVLGEESTVTVYDGAVRLDDESYQLNISVAEVEHRGDVIIPVAAYYPDFEAEKEHVETLVRNVEHPVEL